MSKDRMKKKREREKAAGMVSITIVLTSDQNKHLDLCLSHRYGMTRNEFLAGALVTGAKFKVNSGGNLINKMKRVNNE